MSLRTWINKTLTPRRVLQGCIVLLFSGVHLAALLAVGGFIAHQHENPNPETEAWLYEILNVLELPIAGPLRSLAILPDLFVWGVWMINSLLWGLVGYLICYAVVVGVRRLWRGLTGSTSTKTSA